MDPDALVETKIEDGEKVIRQLTRDHFEITVAFWVKFRSNGSWYFTIASPAIDADPTKAIQIVYATLEKILDCSITPLDLALLRTVDPIARAALALRERYPSREPKRFLGQRLDNRATEEICIYPRPFPWKVRNHTDGGWQVLISEPDDVWLSCESEAEARTIASAPVLQYEALGRLNSGAQFAAELEKTADIMQKYRMDFGSRFLRRRAQDVMP